MARGANPSDAKPDIRSSTLEAGARCQPGLIFWSVQEGSHLPSILIQT